MPSYTAPLRDFRFLIEEFMGLEKYADISGVGDVPPDLAMQVLEEAGKLCEDVLFPLNQSGDAEGVKYNDGTVTLPKGFKEAYQAYVAGGWAGITCDPEFGGQGLPEWLNMGAVEMICSANLSFGITPGLSHGAYNAIHLHASDELKKAYLPKMVTGEWSGVMCLTEPQCGTDLGLIRTNATPAKDGAYSINGTKIFISSGEQDVTDNIIHLVLARLPDAPAGTKGISLFLVPKILPDGKRNNLKCQSIEHKMGIHASPTCVMEYSDATGWLVGEPHKGLKAMFTMMNAARLYVGVQGLGLAEVSYQNALAYTKERLQGRAISGSKHKDKAADPIIVHPDVRRNLLIMKSFVEGARALALFTALNLDISLRHPDAKTRTEADELVQFLTPVVKGYFTDMGFEVTNLGMQLLGGYGYIKEYGMEQYARDARIAQIYEGTNGIQALDLVGRKLSAHTGRYARRLFHPMMEFVEANLKHPTLGAMFKGLKTNIGNVQKASLWIGQKGLGNPDEAAAAATEYLRMLSLVVMGYMWAKMAVAAADKLAVGTRSVDRASPEPRPSAKSGDFAGDKQIDSFYQAKIETAEFFISRVLPQSVGMLACLTQGAKPVMQMAEARF